MFLVLFSNHPSYIEPNIYILQYVILDWLTFQLTPVKKTPFLSVFLHQLFSFAHLEF